MLDVYGSYLALNHRARLVHQEWVATGVHGTYHYVHSLLLSSTVPWDQKVSNDVENILVIWLKLSWFLSLRRGSAALQLLILALNYLVDLRSIAKMQS